MFITAVWVLFLIKLRWPKNKSILRYTFYVLQGEYLPLSKNPEESQIVLWRFYQETW